MPSLSRSSSLALLAMVAFANAASAQPAVSPPPREANAVLAPQEHQKLLDQIEQLKKELAGRKAVLPSGCAIHAKIEKRGDSSVAALRLAYNFRTTAPNSAVSLGAKRSFLVSAKLDGQALPVLEPTDSGFALLVEAAGNHSAVLEVECPVSSRGGKPEIGFELGLPRAAITTLIFEPSAGVTRVALTTRASDAGKAAEARRIAGLDVKSLAPPLPMRDPYPLGAVESLELAWDPPVAAPAADAAQTADADVIVQITESNVEATARIKFRGTSRTWRVAATADAIFTFERSPGVAEADAPTIAKLPDPASVWKLDFPAGAVPADWTAVAAFRIQRAKPTEPAFRGPFPIALSVLDAAKFTGTVRVTAAAHTRLTFKYGRDLRQDAPSTAPTDDETVGFFRIATGPTGNLPPAAPLLSIEAAPLAGRIAVRPSYKLVLNEAGWNVRAELRIIPIRTTVESVTLELPANWRGVELAPPNLVEETTELKADGPRRLLKVSLASEHRQPFDLVLTASLPVGPNAKDASILLPRFPTASERDSLFAVSVPEGTELRGTGREWDGEQPAAWSVPLPATVGADGKPPRNITSVSGKFDRGLARLDVSWSPFRPPLTAEVRADVTVHENQIVVSQRVVLRSPDGLPRTVRFTGAAELPGLAPFDRVGPGSWLHGFSPEQKEATVKYEFAIPLPARAVGKVPIGLVLPAGTSRTDVVARVWVAGGRTIRASGGPWRELPPDPAAERDALPALTLTASGGELTLLLELKDDSGGEAAAVWIERGLLQVSHGDDGTAYRARFLLRHWSADAIDVKLPAAIGAIPEVYLDEPPKRIPAALRTVNGERFLRVSLPEARAGRAVVLDLRYSTPNKSLGEAVDYAAPEPVAGFAGPIRWQITGPIGSVPLLLSGSRSEQRWRVRFGMIAPATASTDELEKWFVTGNADGGDIGSSEAAVLRVDAPAAIAFIHLPRIAFIVGCSIAVLLLGLILSRIPGWLSGPAMAVLAGAVAILAVLHPQPAAQVAAAAEPGAIALVLVLFVQVAARWYHRQRVTYLPGFSRSAPAANGPSTSGGNRPADRPPANASTGALLPQPASTGS